MIEKVEELLELLASRDNSQAYQALKALEEMSAESNCLYPHMDKFIAMASSGNSYVRTRGLALIAHNAKWDVDGKIDGIIDRYLEHITDEKPICARQCIKLLPLLAEAKREERGLSQDEVSKAIFVSRQTISNWENDKTYPDVQSQFHRFLPFDCPLARHVARAHRNHTPRGLQNDVDAAVKSLLQGI